jgi:HSP20 family protein
MNELALLNNFFDDVMGDCNMPSFTFKPAAYNAPRVDVKEGKGAYTLQMDLPGRTEKDINIELDHNVLTISSVHEATKEEKGGEKNEQKWLLRERRYSEFSRRFSLPDDVDGTKLSASFKNGVLTIDMPRKELAAPQRIAITAA